MYLPLHKLKIPASNMRRARYALYGSIAAFITFLVSNLLGFFEVAYYSHQIFLICLIGYVTLAVPIMMIGIAIFLTPFAVYFIWNSPENMILRQPWYWLLSIFCLIYFIYLLIIAARRYPKRED